MLRSFPLHLRFRLQSLLIIVAVFTVYLGWGSTYSRTNRKRTAAIAYLESRGGRVHLQDGERVPWVLRSIVRVRQLPTSWGVDFRHEPGIGDADLPALTELKRIKRMYLNNTKITDRGLEHLSRLTSLELLHLGNTKITDEGMKHLHELDELRALWINMNPSITDRALRDLLELKALKMVCIGGTSITYQGVTKLRTVLPNLSVQRGPTRPRANLNTMIDATRFEKFSGRGPRPATPRIAH